MICRCSHQTRRLREELCRVSGLVAWLLRSIRHKFDRWLVQHKSHWRTKVNFGQTLVREGRQKTRAIVCLPSGEPLIHVQACLTIVIWAKRNKSGENGERDASGDADKRPELALIKHPMFTNLSICEREMNLWIFYSYNVVPMQKQR